MKNIKLIPAAVKECLVRRKSASTYLIIPLCMPNGHDDILFYAATAGNLIDIFILQSAVI